MIQKCTYDPRFDLMKVVAGKAVDLEASLNDFTIKGGITITTNGMETIESVGDRILDGFDAIENFSALSTPVSTGGSGDGNLNQ